MARPKVCLFFAGGTIGMVRDRKTGVLQPAEDSSAILRLIPQLQQHLQLDFKMLHNIDSSNMTPVHWTEIATRIYQCYDNYDGFIVAQGTSTMAYSASAISYALQSLSKPIIFTGSLIPISELGSDGITNLTYALLTATVDIAEVCIVLSNRIMRANRAKKFHESMVAVFHSPNFPYLGELSRPIILHEWRKKRRKRELKFQPNFDPRISVLKLFPGFDPIILDKAIERKTHGIILEGFGPGNVPVIGKNSIIPQIEKAIGKGIPVIVASQMEKGAVNLTAYDPGYQALKAGAISAKDMTTEATVTKLMWTLAQTKNMAEIKKIIEKDLAGELEEES